MIHSEQDALDIVSLCIEHDADAALLEGDSLSDDFVKLSTGLAGAALQKFGNYIQVAAAIKGGQNFPARFQEAVSELGARNTFRIFTNPEDAASWLALERGNQMTNTFAFKTTEGRNAVFKAYMTPFLATCGFPMKKSMLTRALGRLLRSRRARRRARFGVAPRQRHEFGHVDRGHGQVFRALQGLCG